MFSKVCANVRVLIYTRMKRCKQAFLSHSQQRVFVRVSQPTHKQKVLLSSVATTAVLEYIFRFLQACLPYLPGHPLPSCSNLEKQTKPAWIASTTLPWILPTIPRRGAHMPPDRRGCVQNQG